MSNFQTPKTLQKIIGVKISFKVDFRDSIISMGSKICSLKTVISIDEN